MLTPFTMFLQILFILYIDLENTKSETHSKAR